MSQLYQPRFDPVLLPLLRLACKKLLVLLIMFSRCHRHGGLQTFLQYVNVDLFSDSLSDMH